mgnify:CR=1 FL=1
MAKPGEPLRQLIIVLGDQLDLDSVLPDDYDAGQDALWMCECRGEATRAWSHKARLVYFLAAMRHFRDAARERGHRVHYRETQDAREHAALADWLAADLHRLAPQTVVLTRPGDYDLDAALRARVEQTDIPLRWREDPHFYADPAEFADWARGRKQLRLEYWYRALRRREQILIDAEGEPEGGQWNYDADNRDSFGRDGPQELPQPRRFRPDTITQEVIALVEREYAEHPGQCADFDWPVTRREALAALRDFIAERLPLFGQYQDAIWLGEPWLYHSRIAAALNLHLLRPREVVDKALAAYADGAAPLAAVEGFVRQVLGWREFVRGLYWQRMPDWREQNALGHEEPLPAFYWTGDTDMACLHDALAQTLEQGYAHHIQRLMVTGLFALLLRVEPRQVHEWYHAIYVDAVEWVELPNTLGMSQYADNGVLASKPYIASGAYIQRMSNACAQCPYDPKQRHGDEACPYTVLYWDFLSHHHQRFANHPRLRMQLKNLERLDDAERRRIREAAKAVRARLRGEAEPGD